MKFRHRVVGWGGEICRKLFVNWVSNKQQNTEEIQRWADATAPAKKKNRTKWSAVVIVIYADLPKIVDNKETEQESVIQGPLQCCAHKWKKNYSPWCLFQKYQPLGLHSMTHCIDSILPDDKFKSFEFKWIERFDSFDSPLKVLSISYNIDQQ